MLHKTKPSGGETEFAGFASKYIIINNYEIYRVCVGNAYVRNESALRVLKGAASRSFITRVDQSKRTK